MSEEQKKEKQKPVISPKGVAKYAWLNKPDTKFKDAGEYKVTLVMSKEAAEPMMKLLAPLHKKAVAAAKANPKNKNKTLTTWPFYKDVLDDNGDETGEVEFNFKRTASGISKKTQKPWSIVPDLFDAKGRPLPADAKVYGGSIIKVAFTVGAYDKPVGNGISLRLESVQVIKLVEGSGRSATSYGFDDEGDDEDADTDAADGEGTDTDEGAAEDSNGGNADEF